MLSLLPKPGAKTKGDKTKAGADAVWLDLFNPTEAEVAEVEALIGAPLPTLHALSEIEISSRLRQRDGVLTMSTPTVKHRSADDPAIAPIGFVLSPERLVTLRFTPLPAFDTVAHRLEAAGAVPADGPEMFTELCEEIVDELADSLEQMAETLGAMSVATFHADDARGRHAVRSNRLLRARLRKLGLLGDRLSEVREALMGLSRILAFTEQFGCGGAAPDIKARLGVLRQDLASVADYDEHLSNKIQFVLDAMVGLIGIAQNDIFKVLTIVSIAGIPPTLIAGVYGMNFKGMPEYDWSLGYPYALGLIVLSTVLPLTWFKWRGWF